MDKPVFRRIPAPLPVDDTALARLSDSMGIPELKKPDLKIPVAGPQPFQDSPTPLPRPSPTQNRDNAPASKKNAIAVTRPVERLHIQLPGYLTDAINRDAAEQRSTTRYIVMRALAAIGYHIDPNDLVADARRQPRKRKKR